MSERRYVWYDPILNVTVDTPFDLFYAMEAYRNCKQPVYIIKVEANKDYTDGRLFRDDGAILEYIGEL